MFTPDVEKLLRRPTIEKPKEEFILPPPPSEAPSVLSEGQAPGAAPILTASLVGQLAEEAGRTQEMIDQILGAADQVTVGGPTEDEHLLGKTLTTADYIQAVQNPDTPNASRIQQHFEWGLLKSPGDIGLSWSLLLLPDLHDLRNRLVSAGQLMEGTLLSATAITSGSPTWGQDLLNSHVADIHQALMDSAAGFRGKLLQALATGDSSLESQFLRSLVEPATRVPDEELRRYLRKLRDALQKVRALLSHSQLLMAFEYFQVRDMLTTTLKKLVVEQLLHTVTVVLSQTRNALVTPILNLFTGGVDGGHPLLLDDTVSREVAGVLTGTISTLLNHYNNTAADLLREVNREQRLREQKIQALGERNVVGRWIQHIDQATLLIDQALNRGSLTQEIIAGVVAHASQPPAPPNSKLMDVVRAAAPAVEFVVRTVIPFAPPVGLVLPP